MGKPGGLGIRGILEVGLGVVAAGRPDIAGRFRDAAKFLEDGATYRGVRGDREGPAEALRGACVVTAGFEEEGLDEKPFQAGSPLPARAEDGLGSGKVAFRDGGIGRIEGFRG